MPMTTVEVAVRFAVEKMVDDAPPLNIRSEVVALCPAAGWVKRSKDVPLAHDWVVTAPIVEMVRH